MLLTLLGPFSDPIWGIFGLLVVIGITLALIAKTLDKILEEVKRQRPPGD
jgi:hypothetical protein